MARHPTKPALDPGSRRWALAAAAACLLPLLLELPSTLSIVIGVTAVLVGMLSWRRPPGFALQAILAAGLLGTVLVVSDFRIGRDTGCAALAAMLAIKPAETFSLRDARSLVGFALFAPFGTFLLDQGPLALVLGLVAALLALCALQRLADLESGDPVATGATRRFAGIGRLLAIGLPLALAAFWLFPRIASPLWGVPERALGRPGLSGEMTPGQWIDFIADDTPALRVHFFGATPPTSQMYWRGPVMWDYDGRSWTQSDWLRGLPPAPVEYGPVRWDYEVEIEPTDRRQLVSLDLPLAAPAGTRLNHDHELYAPRPLASLSRWRMQSAPPLTYEARLRPALRRAALALPTGYNPRTHALARQWRADARGNDAAIVQRSLDWIGSDFGYTLDTPLPGRHAVDEFLFDQQAGFCEHFSSAFVVLMRAAGVPARVVTGYVGGYRNPLGDYWLVRRSDAHAWAEVWLEGRGWVRVDPTAAVAPERIYDTIDDRLAGADGLLGGVFGEGSQWFNASDWMRRGWNDFVLGFDADRQARLLRPLGIERLDAARLGLLFALAVLLALLWMAWLSRRGEHQPDPVLRAWHRLEKRYRRLGLGREPFEGALDWAGRVSQRRPVSGAGLQPLSQRFSDWRYAGGQPGATPAQSRDLTRQLIRALRAHRPS